MTATLRRWNASPSMGSACDGPGGTPALAVGQLSRDPYHPCQPVAAHLHHAVLLGRHAAVVGGPAHFELAAGGAGFRLPAGAGHRPGPGAPATGTHGAGSLHQSLELRRAPDPGAVDHLPALRLERRMGPGLPRCPLRRSLSAGNGPGPSPASAK